MKRWLLTLTGALLVCAPLVAHHSFATYYLEDDTMEVEGEVIEFQLVNPHAWVHLLGREALGPPKRYAAEWASRSRLGSDGITKDTIRAGDVVRIWAAPNRNPSDNRIRLKRIERQADGWKWGQTRRESR